MDGAPHESLKTDMRVRDLRSQCNVISLMPPKYIKAKWSSGFGAKLVLLK